MYENVKIGAAIALWALWQLAALYLLFVGGTDTFRDVIAAISAVAGAVGFVLFCIVSKGSEGGKE